ncbi:MobA/MobL family protein [Ochrobactrum teleogrylli]|uniref:MobA/MobL family protein n=1 Tax=Ochrobactrum teleogrylli TaxID=2479765 RepID=UPI0015DDACF5|nr:MobA/MobL family protein [[Ochrobactrum] teleogrylli]
MKTSLAPDQALFRAEHQIFSRSKGRSSCAASAYRSASKITDPRTGEMFDYRDKGHVISSFIVAPENAAFWTQDREQIWGRAELAERRQDAQVAREWLITIPRDLPLNQWEPFTREIVAPWIDAGAIADIAIHCPLDQYGQPQPHAHIMLTMRKLDSGTETGFASKKNADLEALHASGGRYGGERGDKLKIQRERIASVMNTYLEHANSPRRVSHLSNAARGLEAEPEPTMGEQRIQTAKSLKKPDHVINEVANHRAIRATKQALTTIEEELMSEFPRMQSNAENGIRPKHQQNFKADLMRKHLPDVDCDIQQLYMIDIKDKAKIKIQMRDSSWVEVEHATRKATVYGPRGQADKLAAAIVAADHADYIDRLAETATMAKRGQKRQQQVAPSGNVSPQIPETVVDNLAQKWMERGYTSVISAPDGCFVTIGNCRIQDTGADVKIHGKPSEAAINALIVKALDEWQGEVELHAGSSQDFKDRLWLAAQRGGVKVYDPDTGKLYEPSPAIRAQFEADKAKMDAQALDLEGIRQRKKVSDLMLEAANGSKDALTDLRERDFHLWLLLTNFDEEQIAAFRTETIESIESQLDGFRAVGRDIEAEAGTPESAAPTPSPDDEPEPRKTKAPQPA